MKVGKSDNWITNGGRKSDNRKTNEGGKSDNRKQMEVENMIIGKHLKNGKSADNSEKNEDRKI